MENKFRYRHEHYLMLSTLAGSGCFRFGGYTMDYYNTHQLLGAE